MKEGFATVYISIDEFIDFIKKMGNFKSSDSIVVGLPQWNNPEEIEIDVAFSESQASPDEWAGEDGAKVEAINKQWEK